MPVTECRVHWHLLYTQRMFSHSQDGLTPLLAATQENHTEIVKLLDAGAADINIRETVLPIQVLIMSHPPGSLCIIILHGDKKKAWERGICYRNTVAGKEQHQRCLSPAWMLSLQCPVVCLVVYTISLSLDLI